MTLPPSNDDTSIDEIVDRVDAAATGAVELVDIQRRLMLTSEDRGSPIAALATALLYIERRDPTSGEEYFGPWIVTSEGRDPPWLSELPQEVLALWDKCSTRVRSPAVRARLHDLCFEARYGQVGAHARAAVQAYVELGDQYGSDVADEMNRILVGLAAVRSLQRALELARRTNQQDLVELTIERLLDHARMALQDGNAGPGVVLGFLGTLAEDRSDIPDLDDLLRAARTRYSDDLWHTRTTIEMQLQRTGQDAAARTRLHREIVQSLLDAAAREPVAMNAVIHLQDAAQFA